METLKEAQQSIAAFMESNEEETMEIVAEELDLDVEAVKDMYTDYDFGIEVTDSDIAGLQKTADFMLDAQMIESPGGCEYPVFGAVIYKKALPTLSRIGGGREAPFCA